MKVGEMLLRVEIEGRLVYGWVLDSRHGATATLSLHGPDGRRAAAVYDGERRRFVSLQGLAPDSSEACQLRTYLHRYQKFFLGDHHG